MAHAIALPHHAHAREPLDGSRIAANAGTILVNATLLLLLLVPLSEQLPREAPKPDDAITIVEIRKERPVPPPEDAPVPIVQRPPVAATQPLRNPQPVVPVEQAIVDTQPGDIAIEPAQVVAETSTLEPTQPPAGAQLQALMSPPPPYPGEAVRSGLAGIVELEILVGIDGHPLEARVVRSSGHRVLDQAARRTVLSKWTFQPAMRNGQPVQALGRVPIEFRLD